MVTGRRKACLSSSIPAAPPPATPFVPPTRTAARRMPPTRCPPGRLERDTEHLLHRGFTQEHLGEAVLDHRLHPAGDGLLAERVGIAPRHDHGAQLFVHLEQLE